MLTFIFFSVASAAIVSAATLPLGLRDRGVLESRANPYSLPGNDPLRALAISAKRLTFTYGPDPAGTSIYYPSGVLGLARTTADFAGLDLDAVPHLAKVQVDALAAGIAVTAAGGLKSLADYELLYKDQWKLSVGDLQVSGMLSNYTQDLLFSMERLSSSPYSIKRLNPAKDTLPFSVDDVLVTKLSGTNLNALFSAGRLFYVDYSSQSKFPPISGRYAAACEAYFFIDPKSGDFLPLAIKPNGGSSLIYTPLDQPQDWLLAKMMFNENDLWATAWYHLASTHYPADLVLEAAIRTLSDDHPVLAILNRINLQAFSFQQAAALLLFPPVVGLIDMNSAFSGASARQTAIDMYANGAGAYQANYFHTQFAARGMINADYGPPLKSFPFAEDAEIIHSALEDFMTSFVNSYYKSTAILTGDKELQAWITEAVAAKIIDFPTGPINDRQILIDILTHYAFLLTVQHHTLNTNSPVTTQGVLPFQPAALYAPIPKSKGVTDILPFLPNQAQAIGQISLLADFARPEFERTGKSLLHMFDDASLLGRLNAATGAAAAKFKSAMQSFSAVVSARSFDAQGLCQGMPFIWKVLDPDVAPYYSAI